MRIGLIDVDGHHFPNIPLMKLSAWHKRQGDSVEWYQPLFSGHMDIVYMSKVFSFTPDYPYFVDSDIIFRGGVDTASNWWMAKKYITPRTTNRFRQKSSISTLTIRSIPNTRRIRHTAS